MILLSEFSIQQSPFSQQTPASYHFPWNIYRTNQSYLIAFKIQPTADKMIREIATNRNHQHILNKTDIVLSKETSRNSNFKFLKRPNPSHFNKQKKMKLRSAHIMHNMKQQKKTWKKNNRKDQSIFTNQKFNTKNQPTLAIIRPKISAKTQALRRWRAREDNASTAEMQHKSIENKTRKNRSILR